jgi:hypothetical protein
MAAIEFPETAPGRPFTVIVEVAMLEQPPAFVLVQVIVHVPAATPVTKPVLEFTVAIAVLLEVHTFVPAVAFDNKVVLFTQTVVVPVLL